MWFDSMAARTPRWGLCQWSRDVQRWVAIRKLMHEPLTGLSEAPFKDPFALDMERARALKICRFTRDVSKLFRQRGDCCSVARTNP